MAATTKQYQVNFGIGAKLLGSFRGVMRMAEQRLKQLRMTAAKVGSAFKGLGGVLSSFAGGLAGFAVGKILSNLFGNASDEAREAETRIKSMQVGMLKFSELMRKAGGDRAKALELGREQTELITAHNSALAKQGVLSDDIYNVMSKQMVIAGVPTKSILNSVEGMGDLLVAIKGVTASEEDAAQLADAMMKAIFSGKTKGLFPYIGALPKDWWKDQIKQGHGYQDMLDDLMKRMEFAKGTAAREVLTPMGSVQHYNNELREMSETIGYKLLPLQAAMAKLWLRVIDDIILPAFARLQKWWQTQTPEAQKRWIKIGIAVAAVGAAFVVLSTVVAPVVTALVALGGTAAGVIAGIVATVIGMTVFWKVAGDTIMAAARYVWDFLKAGWQMLVPELRAIWDDIKVIVEVFVEWFKVLWKTVEPIVMPVFEAIKQAWQFIVDQFEKWKPTIISVFKEIGKVFLDWLLEPLRQFRKVFDAVAGAINKFRPGGAMPASASSLMMAPPPGFDTTPQATYGGTRTTASAAAGAMGGLAGIAGAAGAAGAATAGGGVPVTVASYGGPTEPGQVVGSYNNRLGPGDVAISPNLYPLLGSPGPNSYVMLDGKRYHIADASFYTPGNPTSNMVEIWGYGNQIKRAGTAVRAFADGGVAAAAQLAMIGEGGPEAVIPLSGGRRAAGLLNYASRALGVSTGGETKVSFAPHIVIHGNASEAEQRAMDSRLRDLKDDFIRQFEQAQRQERRLSYEGGYG